jgi:hypothetical protein
LSDFGNARSAASRRIRGPWIVSLSCGIALLVSAHVSDRFLEADDPGLRGLRLIAILAGAALGVLGVLASPAASRIESPRVRWGATTVLVFATLVASAAGNGTSPWLLFGCAAAGCALLPLRVGVATLFGLVSAHTFLTWVSGAKIALTGLPLTALDLRIALSDTTGLWDAMSLPRWTRLPTLIAIAMVLAAWISALLVAGARIAAARASRGRRLDLAARAVVASGLVLLAATHVRSLHREATKDKSTWRPEGVARLAERMGILPFLAYSRMLEAEGTGDFYRADVGVPLPDAGEIRAAVLRHVRFGGETGNAALPNILVVLAESTFDPAAAFRLRGEWDNVLFEPGDLTAAEGPLRVNSIGGGTWIAEFETIVGLDSRLFGYSGMYTHASLSPFVRRSFATWLSDRGYRTWAFFPHPGNFYGGRRAYERYGFERVLDNADLGLRSAWEETDVRIAATVRERLEPSPDSPFFGYVLFIENHAPHACGLEDPAEFPVRFADTDDFEPHCALHEYLRRLGSTTEAVQGLVGYLADFEARTGRPFVLLVFGDHQPHTFTGTGGFQYDYGPLRARSDPHETFFHVFASRTLRRIECCSVAPPTSLLPTLLSGFVAAGPDDVYLGANFWLFDRCGTDAVGRNFSDRLGALDEAPDAGRGADCRSAYERAVAAYRESGVVATGVRE